MSGDATAHGSAAIIIPARYASTRFPGKPLHEIEGVPMLARVCRNALEAAERTGARAVVAADNDDVAALAEKEGAAVMMTDPLCRTGSDRVLEAAERLSPRPDIIVNLQGDAPLIGAGIIVTLLNALRGDTGADVATPVVRLSWQALDALRESKKTNPFSGTFAAVGRDGRAFWFSKNIIPALRKEEELREASSFSPVYRHLGLYAYRYAALHRFASLEEGIYELHEGLEQLRFLENGMSIRAVKVPADDWPAVSGVDSPEDAERVAAILRARGGA